MRKVFHGRWILSCLVLCVMSGNVHSQVLERKVSISVTDELIRPVLDEIEKQAGVSFVYDETTVSATRRVSLDFKELPLRLVLDELCRQAGLRYEVEKGLVLLFRAGERKQDVRQQKSVLIRGKVRDEQKNLIPGVTVLLKGTGIGTVTNHKGFFALDIPEMENVTLVFSFVGMKTEEVKYAGQDSIVVVMEQDVKNVDEVVVTGYQTLKKRSQAGSISTVNAEDLVLTGTQTLEQALQGKIPGMMVMNRSGLTGTRQRIRVRGTSTMLGSAEPVWVVDGVIQEDPLPFETNELNNLNPDNMDMIKDFVGGAISWLNPNDIETITVLKDAASTAIYGVKAANGVIVITTKKGEKGRMAVSYSGSFSLGPRLNYHKMELMNSQQRVEVSREAYQKGYVLPSNQKIGYLGAALAFEQGEIDLNEFNRQAKELETTNTDWFDILFRNSFSHNHNVSISGGGENTSYHASFGINSINNTARGNDQMQYTGNLSMSATLWNKVTLSTNLAGSVVETNAFAGADPFSYARNTNRAIKCYDADGSLSFYPNTTNGYSFNVLNELRNSGNKNTQGTVNTSLTLRWRILEGLAYNTGLSYSYSSTKGQTWYSEQTNYIANLRGYDFEAYPEGSEEYNASYLPVGGELSEMENQSITWSWRNQLEYTKVFNGVHSLTAMIGQEIRSSKVEGYENTTYGYMPDKGKIFVNLPEEITQGTVTYFNRYLRLRPTITETENNYLSFYANLAYMYDNRYSINMSIRSDASNKFGQDKSTRYLPVWALGFRWNVGSEHWLEGQDILSDMSLRFTYGFQGNVAESISPDLIATIVAKTDGGYALEVNQLPAPDLKWEKVQSINVGADFSFFKNKVMGSFEWYTKKTTDMVVHEQVPLEHGVTSRPINGGEMKNSGWDASVNFTPVRTKDLVLTLGFNFGKVKNEVNSTLEPEGSWEEASAGNLYKEGYAVSSFWAFRFAGLNPEHGGPQFDLSGVEQEAAQNDATLYMDYAGKMEPDFSSGMNFTLRYRTWTLSSGLYFSFGNQQFMAPMSKTYSSIPGEEENMSTEWLKRWRNPGDEQHTNIPSLPNIATSAQAIRVDGATVGMTGWNPYELYAYSDVRVVDAWYIRCNSLRLGYTLPTEKLPSFLQNLSFSLSVTNPFQIRSKDFLGRDPEVALGEQPLTQNWALGISMSF